MSDRYTAGYAAGLKAAEEVCRERAGVWSQTDCKVALREAADAIASLPIPPEEAEPDPTTMREMAARRVELWGRHGSDNDAAIAAHLAERIRELPAPPEEAEEVVVERVALAIANEIVRQDKHMALPGITLPDRGRSGPHYEFGEEYGVYVDGTIDLLGIARAALAAIKGEPG